jgi:glutathione S-transferase
MVPGTISRGERRLWDVAEITVVVGNKNYSSWSMRGWLALRMTGEPFDEVVVPLDRPDTGESIRRVTPSGRVPALRHRDLVVWDSLAIGEYLAEAYPGAGLWPSDAAKRAQARAVCAEMHAGFSALRQAFPMNIRARSPGRPRSTEVQADVARIVEIWKPADPFLFGAFSLADAFYAPVATRFATYALPVPSHATRYMDAVLAHPFVKEWCAAAATEPLSIPKYD